MAIHIRTLEKAVAEVCKDNKPLIIESAEGRRAFIESLKAPLTADKRIDRVYMGTVQSSKRSLYHKASAVISTPRRSSYFEPEFCFNERHEFVLNYYSFKKDYYLNGLEDLWRVVDTLHKMYILDDQELKKQEKINLLKTNSMVAKLKEIAAEDGFEYAAEQARTFVNLMVKLTNRDALMIQVPYKNFQEVMQEVRPMIKTIRELSQRGITFKIKGFGYVKWQSTKNENNDNEESDDDDD